MLKMKKAHFFLCVAAFLGLSALSQPAQARFYAPRPTLNQNGAIQWPSNTIDLSQLQSLFSQFPGLNQLNIQFPNNMNWNVTPAQLQNLIGTLQQDAQSVGLNGKVPNLSLTSLAQGALAGNGNQLSIAALQKGDFKGQLDTMVRGMRYNEMNLSNSLPEWLKGIIMAVYNAVYQCMEFLGAQLASLFKR